jgi:hypothetical protein
MGPFKVACLFWDTSQKDREGYKHTRSTLRPHPAKTLICPTAIQTGRRRTGGSKPMHLWREDSQQSCGHSLCQWGQHTLLTVPTGVLSGRTNLSGPALDITGDPERIQNCLHNAAWTKLFWNSCLSIVHRALSPREYCPVASEPCSFGPKLQSSA